METLYKYPKKIFLVLFLLTGLGLYLGAQLPVALYPDSAKPEYSVEIYLENWTARDFIDQYGDQVYGTLSRVPGVEKLVTEADFTYVSYRVLFKWGLRVDDVKRSMETAIGQLRSQIPSELQQYLSYSLVRRNSAFFAASIYYREGKVGALYDEVAPQLLSKLNAIPGVGGVEIDNPDLERLFITLNPERLASHRLSPVRLAHFIEASLGSHDSGSLRMDGREYRVILKNRVQDEHDLKELSLQPLGRPGLKLQDVAQVELAPNVTTSVVFRYNGQRSLILWVDPDTGGNIKTICEQTIAILKELRRHSGDAIQFKVLVNPADFIRAAVQDVEINALIGGFLAVFILMLFVGSFRLTIYSAIEIPLALIWAFILMWCFDVSLNLISLGGLALTAGMNIDASVVMVENIVRHFQQNPPHTLQERRARVLEAVREVLWPLTTSTLITLIVFAPLSLTSGITYAILGDLAKAVVFSHGFSALVALLVVPTVRIYMSDDDLSVHPKLLFFQVWFTKVEALYEKWLRWLCSRKAYRQAFTIACCAASVFAVVGLYPFIRQEVIATPKTDSLWIAVNPTGLSTTDEFAQLLIPYEQKILKEGVPEIRDVFTQLWSENSGAMLLRLRSKADADSAIDKLHQLLPSAPNLRFTIYPWNPSQLHLPRNPDFKVRVTGPEDIRVKEAQRIERLIDQDRRFEAPDSSLVSGYQLALVPHFVYLENIRSLGGPSLDEISRIVAMILHGSKLGNLHTTKGAKRIEMRFPLNTAPTPQDLGAIPIVAGPHILPLQSVVSIQQEHQVLSLTQENGKDLTHVQARLKEEFRGKSQKIVKELEDTVRKTSSASVQLEFADARAEIRESLQGLILALLISLILIAAILYAQFERLVDVLTVMTAIPLGLLGASISLFAMRSTWSLNSILGVIMLGGICVNNSILLVSFFRQKWFSGMLALDAAIESSVVRLKPILITSLTTILAMVPIALGWGEGAEVLQPLGVSVCGGMLCSTLLTLFLIPVMEVSFAKKDRVELSLAARESGGDPCASRRGRADS